MLDFLKQFAGKQEPTVYQKDYYGTKRCRGNLDDEFQNQVPELMRARNDKEAKVVMEALRIQWPNLYDDATLCKARVIWTDIEEFDDGSSKDAE